VHVQLHRPCVSRGHDLEAGAHTSSSWYARRMRRRPLVRPIIQLGKMSFWRAPSETVCIVSLNVIWCPGGAFISSAHEILRPKPAMPITNKVIWGDKCRDVRKKYLWGVKYHTGSVMSRKWSTTISGSLCQTLSNRSSIICTVSSHTSLWFLCARPCETTQ
jgi:hypothetical protein